MSKQQTLAKGKQSYDTIFHWGVRELTKANDLFTKRKKAIIIEVAERLEKAGMEPQNICREITKRLTPFINPTYAADILPDKYKDKKQQERALSGSENRAKAVVKTLVSGDYVEDHPQQQQYEDENIVEAYEIEKLRAGLYSYDYLQKVAIWLHECLELNCRGK